jgi:DNA-binding MltR family transcriptional regulator
MAGVEVIPEEVRKLFPHLTQFFPFLEQLNKESDRGCVLISAGFAEELLRKVLEAFFIESDCSSDLLSGSNAPLGSFRARIDGSFALGLLDEVERFDLNQIRKIRNKFAHQIETSFDDEQIRGLCASLRFRVPSNVSKVEPRGQFTTAAVAHILRLTNRPHYVAQKRRTVETWPL